MDEDSGVTAAPVTRLRRRPSVEAEDSRSPLPSAPSTPTKKRSTRLAAKPQLELIDEHAITNSPKRTMRKSISRDIAEPEEKSVTPARRSTRTKSNTSLVTEAEDKPVTPARRSTRIKSNTSIISEATQSIESPRAKRAVSRRNSQFGSDTEAPLTPARTRRARKASTSSIDKEEPPSVIETAVTPGRTRRTRKGSISSIEIPAEAAQPEKQSLINEVIVEEPEGKAKKSTSEKDVVNMKDDSPTRKSPRLVAKKSRKSKSADTSETLKQSQKNIVKDLINLTKDFDKKIQKIISNKNKSMSDVDDTTESKKRNRTKSWTTLYVSSPTPEGNFYSDSEITKKKHKKHSEVFNDKKPSKDVGSGDGPGPNQNTTAQEDDVQKETVLNISKNNINSSACDHLEKLTCNTSESDKENMIIAPVTRNSSGAEQLFEDHPSAHVNAMVFIEDSDSSNGSVTKHSKQNVIEDQCVPVVLHQSPTPTEVTSTNQETNIFATNNITNNDSVEPMDIDETIPESNLLTLIADKGTSSRRSSLSIKEDESSKNNSSNKSTRKSSVSFSTSQLVSGNENSKDLQNKPKKKSSLSSSSTEIKETENTSRDKLSSERKSLKSLPTPVDDCCTKNDSKSVENKSKRKSTLSSSLSNDRTENENKSTLVLSQIKDISTAENSVSRTPQNTKELSKSMNIVETNKDCLVHKNLNLNYMTSTPVQQKKIDMQMNTSDITPMNENKKENKILKTKPQKDVSMVSKSSANDTSDEDSEVADIEDSSQDNSNLIDDQADDAGEDYESGDSQDDEERQYEKENEIIENGETLTSEEEESADSDYEKDSFVVSSDDQDNELLSGSGDDLNLSDNELTLSANSKKKYNDRKLKEQKKASREMYEARHGHKKSDKDMKSKKSNRNRLDSTLLKSDEDKMPPKKNKRMRLESTQSDPEDTTFKKDEEEIGYKKKKSKRLSESVCHESNFNEMEISACNPGMIQKVDPLSVQIKPEPKTPQKDLDISTVQITDDVEQVHINENTSMMKLNETRDPLQATLLQEKDYSVSENEDSISENEEIANNYDSVLRELNKESSNKRIKTRDTSLDLNKKENRKTKLAIVEELNLTETKTTKKDNSLLAKKKSIKRVIKKLADTDDSSDCIDLQLLFSDDSNGSDEGREAERKDLKEDEESFISLKKAAASTDIRKGECEIENIHYFIDTKGNTSGNANIKNNAADVSDSNDAPLEVLYVSKKESVKNTSKTSTNEKKKKLSELQSDQEPKTLSKKETNKQDSKKKKKNVQPPEDTVAFFKTTPKSPASKMAEELSECHTSARNDVEKLALTNEDVKIQPKKRKRKHSCNSAAGDIVLEVSKVLKESVLGNKNKKQKVSTSMSEDKSISENLTSGKKTKCIKNQEPPIETEACLKYGKKRKERDEDDGGKVSKVLKGNSFDKIHVPRLPPTIIDQLKDMPTKEKMQAKAVSTSNFFVKDTKRKNKPSDFLEETVYLNDNDDNIRALKKKTNLKKPKVLPFLPTVSTSDSGFTTNFHVNIISQRMDFVAQNNEVPNFKNDYLNNKKIKKLRTYDLYKKQRNMKLSKY